MLSELKMKTPSARMVVTGAVILAALSTGPMAAQTTPAAQSSATAVPSGNAENGKMLIKKNGCYQCHGYEGQGGTAGPRIGPGPIAFRAFATYVRAPRGEMPPYTAKVMSEAELADVYAFLQSRPRPPAVNSIPLLAR
jgi:ubiquinol-cytochrome c reductase cytochrome c subunit